MRTRRRQVFGYEVISVLNAIARCITVAILELYFWGIINREHGRQVLLFAGRINRTAFKRLRSTRL